MGNLAHHGGGITIFLNQINFSSAGRPASSSLVRALDYPISVQV
jgi:hypothetical protein